VSRRTRIANDSSPDATEPPNAPSPEEAVAFVKSFPYWYHRIYLGNGIFTMERPGHHEGVWAQLEAAFPSDLGGASVLDVGSNAGYFSIQLKRRGAGRVVGLEPDPRYRKQAEACSGYWGLDIAHVDMDAHDMGRIEEAFDIVMFLGILYHLRSPLQVLEQVGRICRDAVVLETEFIPDDPDNCVSVRQGPQGAARLTKCREGMMKFVEGAELNSDGSNWWVPDTECVKGMLRTVGFTHFSTPFSPAEGRLALIASKNAESVLDLGALG
jgi:tRNA (mo5U34)-methyltransferase